MISRGAIFVISSQVIFLFSGFALNASLARLLGPEDYGIFVLVLSILIIVELFVNTGIPDALKKFGGENPDVLHIIVKKTFPWQLVYCFVAFAVLLITAPLFGAVFHDERLPFLLRIASIDIIFYGLYKYFASVQNGLHDFFKYALLGIIYSLTKVAAIIGLVIGGFSLAGALVGNIIGSVIGLGFGIYFAKFPKAKIKKYIVDKKKYLHFVVPNILYSVGLNLLFSVDLWCVKYFLSDLQVGYYVSAAALAKLPYFLSIGLSAVLLPSLSLTIASKENARTRDVISESIRYLLIILFLLNIVVVANHRLIIELFFGIDYSTAGPILSILIVGLSFTTLMAVTNTILISKNLMKSCFRQIVFLLILDVVLNSILVPRYQLFGAAISTSIVGFLGAFISLLYIKDELKNLVLSLSFPRIILSVACIYFISNVLSDLWLNIIFKIAILVSIYFVILLITKEINAVDLRRLHESIKPKV